MMNPIIDAFTESKIKFHSVHFHSGIRPNDQRIS